MKVSFPSEKELLEIQCSMLEVANKIVEEANKVVIDDSNAPIVRSFSILFELFKSEFTMNMALRKGLLHLQLTIQKKANELFIEKQKTDQFLQDATIITNKKYSTLSEVSQFLKKGVELAKMQSDPDILMTHQAQAALELASCVSQLENTRKELNGVQEENNKLMLSNQELEQHILKLKEKINHQNKTAESTDSNRRSQFVILKDKINQLEEMQSEMSNQIIEQRFLHNQIQELETKNIHLQAENRRLIQENEALQENLSTLNSSSTPSSPIQSLRLKIKSLYDDIELLQKDTE